MRRVEFSSLVSSLYTGSPITLTSHSFPPVNACGNVLMIEREDGSGKNYNVTLQTASGPVTMFVKVN